MFMQNATRFVPETAARPAAPARTGLVATTLVETAEGWCPAGSLRRGDRLHTFDGGLREIIALARAWLIPGTGRLIHIPGGVLGGAETLELLPGQHVLIDTWNEPGLTDVVVALIPARWLSGLAGTRARPVTAPTEIITPVFAEEEAVYANGGLLLLCPGVAEAAEGPGPGTVYPRLEARQARGLMRQRLAA